jgi:hypothetical protein
MTSKLVSRRRILPFLGAAVTALTLFRYTTAEAQTQPAPPASAPAQPETGGTAGMKRRKGRRQGRVERRYERRGGTPASKQPTQGTPAPTQGTPAPTQGTPAPTH